MGSSKLIDSMLKVLLKLRKNLFLSGQYFIGYIEDSNIVIYYYWMT